MPGVLWLELQGSATSDDTLTMNLQKLSRAVENRFTQDMGLGPVCEQHEQSALHSTKKPPCQLLLMQILSEDSQTCIIWDECNQEHDVST